MTNTHVTIDEILTAFFTPQLEALAGVRRTRLQLVSDHLDAFLETDGERILEAHQREILAREREFGTSRAFAKTMHADDLVYAISGWVREHWRFNESKLLLAQLDVAHKLANSVLRQGLVRYDEVTCPSLDIGYAVRTGRKEARSGSPLTATPSASLT